MAMLGNSNATNPPATATGSGQIIVNSVHSNYGYSNGYGIGAGTANDPIKLPQRIKDLRIKGSNFDDSAELHELVYSSNTEVTSNNWKKLPAAFLTNPLRLRVIYNNAIPVGLRAYKIVQNGLESNAFYIQVEADGIADSNNSPTISAVGANDSVFELRM